MRIAVLSLERVTASTGSNGKMTTLFPLFQKGGFLHTRTLKLAIVLKSSGFCRQQRTKARIPHSRESLVSYETFFAFERKEVLKIFRVTNITDIFRSFKWEEKLLQHPVFRGGPSASCDKGFTMEHHPQKSCVYQTQGGVCITSDCAL